MTQGFIQKMMDKKSASKIWIKIEIKIIIIIILSILATKTEISGRLYWPWCLSMTQGLKLVVVKSQKR